MDVDLSSLPDPGAEASPDIVGEGDFDPDIQIPVSGDVRIPVGAPAGRAGLNLLPNDTSLPGENYVLVRPAGGFGGRPSLEAALRAAAPLPAPFEYAIAGDFSRLTGYGSDFSYVERAPSEGVTCVLVVGSSASAAGRPNSVVMRNCVNGGVSLALAPITSFGAF